MKLSGASLYYIYKIIELTRNDSENYYLIYT